MAILSTYALYVVGINVFLSTSLFERVVDTQDPESIFVTYRRGWSIWPSSIHARDLRIRGSDTHVEWLLRIDECRFTVSFYDLALRRTFHVTSVTGSGVSMVLRSKVEAPVLTPEYVDALPVVPGFPRLPIRPLEPPNLAERWDDAHWHLWTVQLDDVTAHDVRDVWIDTLRFEGHATVKGGFYLRPIRRVHLDGIHADLDGAVTLRRRPVAMPLSGSLDLAIAAFDPRTVTGDELLHRVTGGVDVQGRVPDLSNLSLATTNTDEVTGSAELRRVRVRVAEGRIAAGTHVDVAAPGLTVAGRDHLLALDASLLADAAPDPSSPGASRLAFHVGARAVAARRTTPGAEALLFTAPSLEVDGDAGTVDLADPLRGTHLRASLADGEVENVRVLGGYVPPGSDLALDGGRARLHGTVEAWPAEHRAQGSGELDARGLDVRVASLRVHGDATVGGSFARWQWDTGIVRDVKATIHGREVAIGPSRAPRERFVDARAFALEVRAAALDVADPLRAFESTFEVPEATLGNGLLRALAPRGKVLAVAPGKGRFDAHGTLTVEEHRARGEVQVVARRLGVTYGNVDLVADVHARARVHDWALDGGSLALDAATLELGDLSATSHGAASPALRARQVAAVVTSRRVTFARPFAELDLQASLRGGAVSDADAVASLFSRDGSVGLDAAPGGGTFEGAAHAVVTGRVARAEVTAKGRGIGLRGKTIRAHGDLDASARIEGWQLDEGTMRVRDVRVAIDGLEAGFGAGAVATTDLTAKHLALSGDLGRLDVSHPSLRGADYRIVLDDARMDDASRLRALFTPSMSGKPPVLAIESGRARASADVRVSAPRHEASGGVKLAFEHAGVRFHETHLAGDIAIDANVKGLEDDPEGDVVDIGGSRIALRGVQAVGATARAAGWDADLVLLQGAVRVSEDPSLDAFVQLRADDAKPLLALLLRNDVPKVVVSLLEAPSLTGQGRITVESGRAAVRDAHLRGGNVVAIGEYAVVRGVNARGVVTLAKGPFAAGVKLDAGQTTLRLWGLEGWARRERGEVEGLFVRAEAEARATATANADARAKADAKAKADADAKARRR